MFVFWYPINISKGVTTVYKKLRPVKRESSSIKLHTGLGNWYTVSMPERAEYNPEVVTEETYQKHAALSRTELGRLYDEAVKLDIPPQEFILSDPQSSFDEMEELYGPERTAAFKEAIQSLAFTDKDSFVDAAFAQVQPLIRDRLFNDEIRRRANEVIDRRKVEEIQLGNFKVVRMPSEWTCSMADGTIIRPRDLVLNIEWPEKEEGVPPAGIRDVRSSFQQIATYLQEHPDIKGVVGISWMMSHPVTDRLGFEKFPDIDVPQRQIRSILNMAGEARGDKYDRPVGEQDVQFGAISRDAFIEKYG